MRRQATNSRRLVLLLALGSAAWVSLPIPATPQAPASRFENLLLIADFARGNPGVVLRDASGESESIGSWRRLVEQFQKDPFWKTFPGRDLRKSIADPDVAQLVAFDFLGHQGWRLAAAQSGMFQRTAATDTGSVQFYFFDREL